MREFLNNEITSNEAKILEYEEKMKGIVTAQKTLWMTKILCLK